MGALLLFLKNAIGTLAMYYLKKHAAELVVDATLEIVDQLSQLSSSDVDDNYVKTMRNDRDEAIKIVRKLIK